MKISDKTWDRYISRLERIDRSAAEKVGRYLRTHEWFNGTAAQNEAVQYAYAVATSYGEAAAEAACLFYDEIAEDFAKGMIPAAVPAKTASYGEVRRAVEATGRNGNPNAVSQAVGRLVKRTGADTTLQNAIRDRAEFAWVPSGDSCAFCIALASRGWQTASTRALKGGHAEHIHPNCNCTYAIRFNRNTQVAGYDPDKYAAMYYGAEGDTPDERINAMRRAFYDKNRDKINAQKRAAYAERATIDYRKVVRDPDKAVTVRAKEGDLSLAPIQGSRNEVMISEGVVMKPRELHTIEQQIDKAKEVTGLSSNNMPKYAIVADTDLGVSTGGRFDPATNTIMTKQFQDKAQQLYVIVHESFHGKDYQDFIADGGVFTDLQSYIDTICKKVKPKLDKIGVNEYNVMEISEYALDAYRKGRFDEVYTEYRTVKALKG